MTPHELNKKCEKKGIEWAKSLALTNYLDDAKKSFLSTIMTKIDMASDGKLSENRLERLAVGEQEYRDYLKNMSNAKSESCRLRVEYDKLIRECEFKRSEMSLEKAKMNLI